MTCDKCKFWFKSEYSSACGKCKSSKFIDTSKMWSNPNEIDSLFYSDAESYKANFDTGPKFGCIHFKSKLNDMEQGG